MLDAAAHGVAPRGVYRDTAIYGVMLDVVAPCRAPNTSSTRRRLLQRLRQHSSPALSKRRRGKALLHRLVILR